VRDGKDDTRSKVFANATHPASISDGRHGDGGLRAAGRGINA